MKKLLIISALFLLVFFQTKGQNRVLVSPCKTCEWKYSGSANKLVTYEDTKKKKVLFELKNAEAGSIDFTKDDGYIEIKVDKNYMYVSLATNEVFFEIDKILFKERSKIANAPKGDFEKNFIFLEDRPSRDAYNAIYVMKYKNGKPNSVEKVWEEKASFTNITKNYNQKMRDKNDFALAIYETSFKPIYFDYEGKNITKIYQEATGKRISSIIQSKYPEAATLKWEANKPLPNFPMGGGWSVNKENEGLLIYTANGKSYPTPFVSRGYLEYYSRGHLVDDGKKKYREDLVVIETANQKGLGLLDIKNNYLVIAPDTDLINIELLERYPFNDSPALYFWTSYKDSDGKYKQRVYGWAEGDLLPNKKYIDKLNAYSTWDRESHKFANLYYEPIGDVRLILKEYTGKTEGDKELFIYHSFLVENKQSLKRINRPDKTYGKVSLKNNASNAYMNGAIIKGLENVVEHRFIEKQNLLFCRADNSQVFLIDVNSGEIKDKLYIRNLETDIYKNLVKNAEKYQKEVCGYDLKGYHLFGIYDLSTKKQIVPVKNNSIFINSIGIAAINQCSSAQLFNLNTLQEIKTKNKYIFFYREKCKNEKSSKKDCFVAVPLDEESRENTVIINMNGIEEE
jgi:hypothetical protein